MNDSTDARESKQWVIGLFNRAGTTYDQVGPRFFSHFGRRLVEDAHIPQGARVLDVASGRGAVLFPAAQAVGDSGLVIGTDISETMVNETRHEIQIRKLKNATVQEMDAEDLLFPDASFDFVLCGFALFFFPNLDKALAEIQRVLRPGGYLAVSTWEKYEDERWKWFDELIKVFLSPEGKNLQVSKRQPTTPDMDTPEAMKSVLEAAGFIVEKCLSERLEVVYRSEDEWWTTQWSHGGRVSLERIVDKLGPEGLERFKQVVFENLKNIQQEDGIHSSWPALFTLVRKPC